MTKGLTGVASQLVLAAAMLALHAERSALRANDLAEPAPQANGPTAQSSPGAANAPAPAAAGATPQTSPPTTAAPSAAALKPLPPLYVPCPHDWNPCCPNCRETRIFRSEILGRLWVSGEYLIWATKPQQFGALVTSSPGGTAPEDTGVLGLGTTNVLVGGDRLLGDMRSGARLTAGFWWNPDQRGGFQVSWFELEEADLNQRYIGDGDPLLARPFVNATTGDQASRLIDYPGIVDGSIRLLAETKFSGAEALFRHTLNCAPSRRIELVGGYRFTQLADNLRMTELLSSQDPVSGYDAGTRVFRWDQFDTENEFHGGELGLIAQWWRQRVSLQVQGKIALGETWSNATAQGLTIADGVVYRGGVLALPTNMGTYGDSQFSAVGELGVSLGFSITCLLRATVGYNFLYWSDVARVADQIDPRVNPSQFPPGSLVGARRPQFDLQTTDFWAQGLNLGLEYQF